MEHGCPFIDQLRYRRVYFDDVSVVSIKTSKNFQDSTLKFCKRDFLFSGRGGQHQRLGGRQIQTPVFVAQLCRMQRSYHKPTTQILNR